MCRYRINYPNNGNDSFISHSFSYIQLFCQFFLIECGEKENEVVMIMYRT